MQEMEAGDSGSRVTSAVREARPGQAELPRGYPEARGLQGKAGNQATEGLLGPLQIGRNWLLSPELARSLFVYVAFQSSSLG